MSCDTKGQSISLSCFVTNEQKKVSWITRVGQTTREGWIVGWTARVGQLFTNHVVWAVEMSEFGLLGLL